MHKVDPPNIYAGRCTALRNEKGLDLWKSFYQLEDQNRQLKWEIEQLKERVTQLENDKKFKSQTFNTNQEINEEEFDEEECHGSTHWHNEY